MQYNFMLLALIGCLFSLAGKEQQSILDTPFCDALIAVKKRVAKNVSSFIRFGAVGSRVADSSCEPKKYKSRVDEAIADSKQSFYKELEECNSLRKKYQMLNQKSQAGQEKYDNDIDVITFLKNNCSDALTTNVPEEQAKEIIKRMEGLELRLLEVEEKQRCLQESFERKQGPIVDDFEKNKEILYFLGKHLDWWESFDSRRCS